MKKYFESFAWALNGLSTVWREEKNFRIEIFFALVALVLGFLLDVTKTEFLFIIVACIFVLTGEIINTAIEDLCDKVEPKFDPIIGKIKDTMAAFVLFSSIGSTILGILIFGPKIFDSIIK